MGLPDEKGTFASATRFKESYKIISPFLLFKKYLQIAAAAIPKWRQFSGSTNTKSAGFPSSAHQWCLLESSDRIPWFALRNLTIIDCDGSLESSGINVEYSTNVHGIRSKRRSLRNKKLNRWTRQMKEVQMKEAIDYLHNKGCVWGDAKPDNF